MRNKSTYDEISYFVARQLDKPAVVIGFIRLSTHCPAYWANFAGIELIEIKSDSENSAGSNSPARRNVAFI
jgi:hypothetical protein